MRTVARIALAFLLSAAPLARSEVVSEHHVKATFLMRLAKFVEWPPGTFANPETPLAICVVGDAGFADLLEEVVRSAPRDERGAAIVRLNAPAEAKGCHLLYFGASEKRRLRAALGALGGANILTAGATEGFALQGCVIDFWLEARRVRFAVNLQAALRAQLKISSKLLSLAARVVNE